MDAGQVRVVVVSEIRERRGDQLAATPEVAVMGVRQNLFPVLRSAAGECGGDHQQAGHRGRFS